MTPAFRNRTEAGGLLAAHLRHHAADPGLVVLGLARGGVPVAVEVAQRLGATIDVLVVRKMGVPCQAELAMGAVAPGGVCILNDRLIDRLDIESDAIGAVRRHEEQVLQRREQLYRGLRPLTEVGGKTVIVVDDGVATGATMHAAVIFLHQREAGRVVVAAPVIAREAYRELQGIATEVVAIVVSGNLGSIGAWYEDFTPTTDAEVRRLLGAGRPAGVAP